MNDVRADHPIRPTLEGVRIVLRPTEDADYLHGYRWELDPDV